MGENGAGASRWVPSGEDPAARLAAELRSMQTASQRTLRELERPLHTSSSSLSRYLTGRSLPPWPVAEALCHLVGRDPEPVRHLWEAARNGPGSVTAPTARNDLPRDTLDFVGRTREAELLLDRRGVWVIDGMPGVGKTALAVRAAHLLVDQYPDGQFYVDLHGSRDPFPTHSALENLLLAVGVPAKRIPDNPDARASLWRAELAARRSVVVVDDAGSAEHVYPLLPGTDSSTMLITSRRRLIGLENVRSLSLDVLSPAEAVELLTVVTTDRRTASAGDDEAERAARAEIAELCGYLPLAVRICAARLNHRPTWTAQRLADRLRQESRRLVELDAGDGGVVAALTLSAEQLDVRARHLFALLGSAPGPVVDTFVAAAAADVCLEDAEDVLEALTDAHLLEPCGATRYRLHDLTRDYTRSLEVSDRETAQRRILDYYLHCVKRAVQLFDPFQAQAAAAASAFEPDPPAHTPDFADRDAAEAWLDREIDNLLGAARDALAHGAPQHTIALARQAYAYFQRAGRTQEWVAMNQLAVAAARAVGSPDDEAWALLVLGVSHRRAGDTDAALAALRTGAEVARHNPTVPAHGSLLHALALTTGDLWQLDESAAASRAAIAAFDAAGNPTGAGMARTGYAMLLLRLGRPDEAEQLTRTAQKTFETTGYDVGRALAAVRLGDIDVARRHFAPAIEHYRQAIDQARLLGHRELEANAHNAVAVALRRNGDTEAAAEHHEQARGVVETDGHQGEMAFLIDEARTHLAAGRTAPAEQAAKQGLEIARARGNAYEQARALRTIAAARLGDQRMARRLVAEAETLLAAIGASDDLDDVDDMDDVDDPNAWRPSDRVDTGDPDGSHGPATSNEPENP
ncbi:ATP-binding protein [Catenulispora pinisilvae]|uniref:ATP-binding protein n=1 Tax=Catenulispora pinisilvae TaxID=2705253 RepID=UPI002B277002|nr:helix-turn-helix domain-containing protein [Catenulispora pinisilvae]